MRLFVLYSNEIGEIIINNLITKKDTIVAVGFPKSQKIGKKIINLCKKLKIKIFYLEKKISKEFLLKFKTFEIDYMLSIYWPYILKENFFSLPKNGTINFHLSYLPFNRGKNPNIWPIIDGSPAGVSLHLMNKKVDEGDIICQSKIKIDIIDNAEKVYKKLAKEIIKLFIKNWNNIKSKKITRKKQKNKSLLTHTSKHFKDLSRIKMNKKIYPIELINLLRAKTFSNKEPAYFFHNGKKIFVHIKLRYEKN